MYKEETENYIKHLISTRHISQNTGAAYLTDLRNLCSYAGDIRWEKMDAPFLQAYMEHLKMTGMAVSSRKRTASVIRGFFGYLEETGKIREDVSEELYVSEADEEKASIPQLTDREMKAVLEAAGRSEKNGKRDIAVLKLIAVSGIKASELTRLRICDFDFLLNSLIITAEDGSRRKASIGNDAGGAVQSYIEENREHYCSREDIVFLNYEGKPLSRQGIWKMIKGIGAKAGIKENLTPDRVRKSYINSDKNDEDLI